MERCARKTPPPPFNFRSHRHGDPFPRFEDEFTGEIASSFASDIHALWESQGECEMSGSMSCPRDICDTVSDLVDEVGKHLEKTSNGLPGMGSCTYHHSYHLAVPSIGRCTQGVLKARLQQRVRRLA